MVAGMDGPHWDSGLIGPRGELTRLHKGAKAPPPPAPPPPVSKEADALDGALQLQEDIRRRRRSYVGSFLGGTPGGSDGPSGSSYLGSGG